MLFFSKRKKSYPDFMILGTEESTTFKLYQALGTAKGIRKATAPDVDFFDLNRDKDITWYHSLFPRKKNEICGDYSAHYFFNPEVPARIQLHTPEMKFIVLLQDPEERALKHYQLNAQKGFEELSPFRAMIAEESRMAEALKRGEDHDTRDGFFRRFDYKYRGEYVDFTKQWFKFFPKEQFFISRLEDLEQDPDGFYKELSAFLGANIEVSPRYMRDKFTEKQSDKWPEAHAYLKNYFSRPFSTAKKEIALTFGDWND